ncbi:MAG: glycosyltransferase family 4 protein, partial [Thermoplasmata archaeon]
NNVAFCWFAEVHSLWTVRLARILGKKSIVVVGGYETARIPEIGYGLLLDKRGEKMVREIFERADKLIPVSNFIMSEMLAFGCGDKIEVVHNGIDFSGLPSKRTKEDIVVTVGDATVSRCKLKGIDTFVRAAEMIPNVRFVVVGDTDDNTIYELKKISARVEYTGRLPHDELLNLLARTKVYCQLSMRESFGMALLEAAALGCKIIATEAGAIPEIMGNNAIYVPYGDYRAAAIAIKGALSSSGQESGDFVAKSLGYFSIREREKALTRIIRSVVG